MNRPNDYEIQAGDVPAASIGWGQGLGDDGATYWQVRVAWLELWARDPAVLSAWLRAAADDVDRLPAPVGRDETLAEIRRVEADAVRPDVRDRR